MTNPNGTLCPYCAYRATCTDWARHCDYKQARPVPKPKEVPMPELKPCPICGAPAERPISEQTRCSNGDCLLGRLVWLNFETWQALPRIEMLQEVHDVPETRTCHTCFFTLRDCQDAPCCDCSEGGGTDDSHSNWRPNRPGDEVRIRDEVEWYISNAAPTMLGNVVWAGKVLANHMGVSYPDALSSRMSEATARLGPWDVHDGRDYRHEALEELLDAACYLAAEKVREEKR